MKLSEMIMFLEAEKKRLGDVEVHTEMSDGHSTFGLPLKWTAVVFRKLWKGHGQPAQWYLT